MNKDFEVLDKLVRSNLILTPRHERELELLSEAPEFIPKSFLKAYQHVILNKNNPSEINECESLIAFELGLTTKNPGIISFHYPVEPGSFPDYDTDFAYPDKVKEYIRKKYGEEYVTSISTYGSYKIKSLLKSITRVITDEDGERVVSLEEINELNKKLPFKINAEIASDMAEDEISNEDSEDEDADKKDEIFTNKDIVDFQRKYPEIFKHVRLLYALPTNKSKHAGGIVIFADKARNTLPLTKTKDTICTEYLEGQGVTELSSIGAIKIDILGLKTLKILDTCNKLIMSRYRLDNNFLSPCICKKEGKVCKTNYVLPFLIREATSERLIDFNKLCLNVPKIYEAIGDKQNEGVFQFEPDFISAFTKQFQPKEFYDLALITALYRPGPLDAKVDDKGIPIDSEDPLFKNSISAAFQFIERRHGRAQIYYPSTKVKSILEKTNAVIIFQETLSQVIMAMTNCSFADAEKVRKFLTKVKPELVKTDPDTISKLKSFKDKFNKECIANNCDKKEIDAVWNLIVPFARYGFSVNHAVAYSLISYQTAFCRTLFPLEYLTSLIIHNIEKARDKVIQYIRTAQKLNLNIIPIDINTSNINFTIDDDNNMVSGLLLAKGIGEKAATHIVNNRNEFGPFKSLEDFLSRDIYWRHVDIGVLEVLVHCGAFDSISSNRKLTWAKIQVAKGKKKLNEFEISENKDILLEDYSKKEKIDFEKEIFDFLMNDYLSANKGIIDKYSKTLNMIAVQKNKHMSIGTVEEIKVQTQKNGLPYARITVTNINGSREQWLLFASTWGYYKNTINIFDSYFALGKKDDKKGKDFIVDSVQNLTEIIKQE